jgi:hypothetical protein
MDKKTAGYRAFATRIVTRGAFTAEQTPKNIQTRNRTVILPQKWARD